MTQAEEQLKKQLERTLDLVQEWREQLWKLNTDDLPYSLQVKLERVVDGMISVLRANGR